MRFPDGHDFELGPKADDREGAVERERFDEESKRVLGDLVPHALHAATAVNDEDKVEQASIHKLDLLRGFVHYELDVLGISGLKGRYERERHGNVVRVWHSCELKHRRHHIFRLEVQFHDPAWLLACGSDEEAVFSILDLAIRGRTKVSKCGGGKDVSPEAEFVGEVVCY